MSPIVLALITLACTFGSAWLGTTIRAALPETHLTRESQDTVRLGMGLVATMTALLLGLVTAAAKGSFDAQDAAVRASAVNIMSMDRHLARYGPETQPIRELVRRAVEARLNAIWRAGPTASRGFDDTRTESPAEEIQNRILALSPTTESQRWLRMEALKLSEEIMKARWRVLESHGGAVPRAFLVVVVAWLTVTFASFGLFAPRNATVLSVLFIAAASVSAAMFLILELDGPFQGLIKTSSGPFEFAVRHLGR